MIKGIEHIGICSKDTEALKNWYIQLFHLKVVYENTKSPKTYFLSLADGSMIEIYPSDAGSESVDNKTQGIRHLAFTPDNFEEMGKMLMNSGVEIVEAAKTSPSGVKTLFFKDPEGNIIHLIDRPVPLI